MNLLRVSQERYEVLAVAEGDWSCSVLQHLEALEASCKDAAAALRQILVRDVPEDGPDLTLTDRSKHLREGVYEFRVRTLSTDAPKGKSVRIEPRTLFFQDGSRIICVLGYTKDPVSRQPFGVVDQVLECRRRYDKAKFDNTLTIVDIGHGI